MTAGANRVVPFGNDARPEAAYSTTALNRPNPLLVLTGKTKTTISLSPPLSSGGRKVEETVAQHFMMTCIRAHGVRAEWLAQQLESRQPLVYSAWRECGFDTTWDGCRELIEKVCEN